MAAVEEITHVINNSAQLLEQQLLCTKFYVPSTDDMVVTRPHLTDQLQASILRHRLTLISAPPGSGKTTLLAEWRATTAGRAVPLAWLSLEEADNEPLRFWTYFISAIREVLPDLGDGALSVLRVAQPKSVELATTIILNELSNLSNKLVLVLDDYHVITSEAIHQTFAALIDRLPVQVHLILTSRKDPPLPLSRLRVRRQLGEIRAEELRFTNEEALIFLNQMGLNLADQDSQTLVERTEGWIAGLQLAALSMQGQGRKDSHQFIASFRGDHHLLQDYLLQEVLERQPLHIKNFLLETSILLKITGPLCNVVTQRTDSSLLLTELARANLFVVPLDNTRQWFRYHHLFAEMLYGHLQQTEPEKVAILHRRAAGWYSQIGMTEEAINQLLAAGDNEAAEALIESIGPLLLTQYKVATLMRWSEILPDTLVRANPLLSLYCGNAHYMAGFRDLSISYLESAEQVVATWDDSHAKKKRVVAYCACSRAYDACDKGRFDEAARLSDIAMSNLEDRSDLAAFGLRSFALSTRTRLYYATGDLENLIGSLSQLCVLHKKIGNQVSLAVDTARIAAIKVVQGQLSQARDLYLEALSTLSGNKEQALINAVLHLGLSGVLSEQGDLKEAEENVEKAVSLTTNLYLSGFNDYCTTMLAIIRLSQGNLEAVRTIVNPINSLETNYYYPSSSTFNAYLIQLKLAIFDLDV